MAYPRSVVQLNPSGADLGLDLRQAVLEHVAEPEGEGEGQGITLYSAAPAAADGR